MGQSVSVDGRSWELRELLRITGGENAPESGAPQQPARRAAAKHHIKAWQFEEDGRAVVDSPVTLCDKQGLLDVEIRRSCSYLLLHVWTPSALGEEAPPSSASAVLEDLAARAGATFTPRGLAGSVLDVRSVSRNAANSDGPGLRHAIFVWHGLDVSQTAKARAFARAFELDGAIGDGLLRHPAFLDSLADAAVLRGTAGSLQKEEGGAVETGTCGRNQLLHAILQGMPPATGCGGGRRGAGRHGGTGCRFPRLARDVGRSLGLSQTQPLPSAAPTASVVAAQPAVATGPVPPQQLLPASAAPAAVVAPAPTARQPPVVPRLALGLTGLAAAAAPAPAAPGTARRPSVSGEASMDVDATVKLPMTGVLPEDADSTLDDGMRSKRLRGGSNTGPFNSQGVGASSTVAPPKSARVGDPSSSQPVSQESAPRQRGGVPVLNIGSTHASASAQRAAAIADPPAMLNLEEINMSEEDLIRSYDPNNEENNYHLPDHLYKSLQLKQYRQACSEVVPNAVYLGGYQVAGDLECLKRHGITHIVNMAADVCDSSFPEHFRYITYYLKDTNSEDISPLFYRTLDWMQSAVEGGGRVLVHCREGVSRSATMAIAYLMWRQGLSFEAAHDMLRKARPICNPNTGFTCQLLLLGKRLGVGARGGQAAQPAASASDRPQLFRVAPHHHKEPFLLLVPSEWPRTWPHFDSRFGWVVQRGSQLYLWLGSQVVDPEPVQAAVQQHVRLVEAFERQTLALSIMSEGAELPQLFEALAAGGAPPEACGLSRLNPDLDADFEVTRASTGGASPCERSGGDVVGVPPTEEVLTESSLSNDSSSQSLSSASLQGIGGG